LFTAAAQFEKCRDKIVENPSIIKNICRCLHIKGAPQMTIGAIECISAFSVDTRLQEMVSYLFFSFSSIFFVFKKIINFFLASHSRSYLASYPFVFRI